MRQSKNRGGSHRPVPAGLGSFAAVSMDALGSRTGSLTWQVLGPNVPVGSTRLWASQSGNAFQPLDRYEVSAGDAEPTPVLDATLLGGSTVTWYLDYRDAMGELIATSLLFETVFPPD